jgi:hypothetical protein
MTFRFSSSFCVATLIAAWLFASRGALAQDEVPFLSWHDDYLEGLAEARETGKPIVLELRCVP